MPDKTNIDNFLADLNSEIRQGKRKYNFKAGINREKILLYCHAYGLKLPEAYIKFLENHNGGMILEYEPEYYTDMLDDEPDGPRWSSFYFYSLEEMIENHVDFFYDHKFVGTNFSGVYPFIPFCKSPEPVSGRFLICSQKELTVESPVFYYSYDKELCFQFAENFTEFFDIYQKGKGFPKIEIDRSKPTINEFIEKNNIIQLASNESNEEGISRLNSFLELFPNDAWSYCERANLKVKIKEYQSALKDFNIAIELDAEEAFFYNCRGELHLYQGDPRVALIDLDSAVTLDPEDMMYLNSRAKAFLKLDKLHEALVDCDTVLQKDSKDIIALSTRYDVYMEMGEYDLALDDQDLIDEIIEE